MRIAGAIRKRFRIAFLAEGLGEHAQMAAAYEIHHDVRPAACVITDLVQPRSLRSFARVRKMGPSVSLHDMGLGQFESDCAIDGSVVQVRPFPAGRRALYLGPKYAVLDPGLSGIRGGTTRRVFVNFGGGDVRALYRKAVRALDMIPGPIDIRACRGYTSWDGVDSRNHRTSWIGPCGSLSEGMAGSALALCAGGTALYEAARTGLPAVVLSHHRLQERTAKEFERLGAAISLGTYREVGVDTIRRALETMLCAPEARRRMGRAGRRIVDGRGLERVSKIIARFAEGRA